MKALVLLSILAGAAFSAPAPKPQFNQAGAPVQAILLQGTPQVSYNQPTQYSVSTKTSTNAIPAGAQIIYLQSQPQYAYPQGQIAYIQGTPQTSFATFQTAAVPNQQAFAVQPAEQSFSSYQSYTQAGAPQVKNTFSSANAGTASSLGFSPLRKTVSSISPGTSSSLLGLSPTAKQSYSEKTSSFAYKKPQIAQPIPSAKSGSSSSSGYYHGSSGQAGKNGYIILKQSQNDNFDGSFNYNYETDHGISVDASGYLKNAGTEDEAQVIQGSYTYYTPEGTPIVTTYTADENGFVAYGDHLPKVPEIIAKAIAYQRSLPPSVEDQK